MRITSISMSQKVNTGKYESLDFTADANVDEGDDANECALTLANFVDWYARKPIREEQARANRQIIANEQATPDQKHVAEVWLKKYEERKLAVEAT